MSGRDSSGPPRNHRHRLHALLELLVIPFMAAGCASPSLAPVPDSSVRDALASAWESRGTGVETSLQRSRHWAAEQSDATAAQTRMALNTLAAALHGASSGDEFADRVLGDLQPRAATGTAGDETIIFTAYFAPEYPARRVRVPGFPVPLYRAPIVPRLQSSPGQPGPTRTAITDAGLLRGSEIAWLPDEMSAYLVHVNGSARLRLEDGTALHVGHDGTNERPYTSLGRLLIDAGIVDADAMSMQAIVAAWEQDPAAVEALMRRNDRYVYFREIAADAWPASSLGIALTPEASIATDKTCFPAGAPALVITEIDGAPFVRLVFDQDSGGAIVGPGRADIYIGAGPQAGAIAGGMHAKGRMIYLLPR